MLDGTPADGPIAGREGLVGLLWVRGRPECDSEAWVTAGKITELRFDLDRKMLKKPLLLDLSGSEDRDIVGRRLNIAKEEEVRTLDSSEAIRVNGFNLVGEGGVRRGLGFCCKAWTVELATGMDVTTGVEGMDTGFVLGEWAFGEPRLCRFALFFT